MRKSEIIIVITTVVLAVLAIVVGTFAFRQSEEEIKTGVDEIGEFFSEIAEKKPEETTTTPEVTTTPEKEKMPDKDEPYIYDENGNVIKEFAKENSITYYYIYEYDENNLMTSKEKTDIIGKTEYTFTYYYDDEGRLTTRHRYNEYGRRTSYTTYEYDTEGFARIESAYSLSDDSNEGLLAFKTYYDENEYMIKQEKYSCDGIVLSLHECDPETQKSSLTEYDVFTGEKIKYTEYDENGEIIKEETY